MVKRLRQPTNAYPAPSPPPPAVPHPPSAHSAVCRTRSIFVHVRPGRAGDRVPMCRRISGSHRHLGEANTCGRGGSSSYVDVTAPVQKSAVLVTPKKWEKLSPRTSARVGRVTECTQSNRGTLKGLLSGDGLIIQCRDNLGGGGGGKPVPRCLPVHRITFITRRLEG